MPKLPSLPDAAALSELFKLFPGHVETLMPFVDSVLRGPGEWDIAERELIAAYVSSLNACSFCLGGHVLYAEAFGLPPEQLEAALQDPDTAGLEAGLTAVLHYVRALNTMPHRLRQSDMDAVLGAGVTERALYEAVLIAALFNMMNRVAEGTGVTFDARTDPSRHSLAQMKNPREHRFVAAGPKP
jgi:uncharacterized peroxidase-related enzyme